MPNKPIHAVIDGIRVEIGDELISRYDEPLPRYTSYPPAPAWRALSSHEYETAIGKIKTSALSLYIHIPFCKSKCAFCGCSAIATSNKKVMERYLSACASEIALVSKVAGGRLRISQLHFGGGTPLSVGASGIKKILDSLRGVANFEPSAEIAIEIDPRTTTEDDIEFLSRAGFNRISIGVQDFDPAVGSASGRISDEKWVARLVEKSRSLGISGINFDLIYGLPAQNLNSWGYTLDSVAKLNPDRVAVFNFAHLPNGLPHQRALDTNLMPPPREKLALFLLAIEKFGAAGYAFIGLDHFARKGDSLELAHSQSTLTRTFQGYTTGANTPLLGIGATSISETKEIYAQNEKKLIDYMKKIEGGTLATSKGLRLTRDDQMRRWIVRSIMCKQRLSKRELKEKWGMDIGKDFSGALAKLKAIERDGIVWIRDEGITVTPLGRIFVRHVASVFDSTLGKSKTLYSRGI